MNSTTPISMNKIKSTIEALVLKEAGVTIEWTFTGHGFTVSGKPADVKAAAPWFRSSKLGSMLYDAEIDEMFAYYT